MQNSCIIVIYELYKDLYLLTLTAGYFSNDLWKFDGQYWTWMHGSNDFNSLGYSPGKGIIDPLNIPGSRESHSVVVDSEGNTWLFGGTAYATNTGQLGKYPISILITKFRPEL